MRPGPGRPWRPWGARPVVDLYRQGLRGREEFLPDGTGGLDQRKAAVLIFVAAPVEVVTRFGSAALEPLAEALLDDDPLVKLWAPMALGQMEAEGVLADQPG